MRFYLLRHDGTVSDSGDYLAQPDPRDDGEWTEGFPPAEAPKFSQKTLLEILQDVFSQIPRDTMPDAYRGHFRILKVAVHDALYDSPGDPPDIGAAKALIENATLPDGSPLPESMEPFRQELLGAFPNA